MKKRKRERVISKREIGKGLTRRSVGIVGKRDISVLLCPENEGNTV